MSCKDSRFPVALHFTSHDRCAECKSFLVPQCIFYLFWLLWDIHNPWGWSFQKFATRIVRKTLKTQVQLIRNCPHVITSASFKGITRKSYPLLFTKNALNLEKYPLSHPSALDNFPFQKLEGKLVQAFGATISGTIWVDKRWLWLVNGCLGYHRPIITNACSPKRSQNSLRLNLVSILPRDSKVENLVLLW